MWTDLFKSGTTVLRIADRYKVDPETISRELHRLGFMITPGHHVVEQLPLKYSLKFIELIDRGADQVLEFVRDRVWGIQASQTGKRS